MSKCGVADYSASEPWHRASLYALNSVIRRSSTTLATCTAAITVASVLAQQPAPAPCASPLTEVQIEHLLKEQVHERRVVQLITACGITFASTAESERLLRKAQATNRVLDAIRAEQRKNAELAAARQREEGLRAAAERRELDSVQDNADRRVPALKTAAPAAAPATPGSDEEVVSRAGTVVFSIVPWGEITVDNQRLGATPVKPQRLGVGEHKIQIVHPNYGTVNRTVVVRADATTRVSVDMMKEGIRR